MREASAPRAEPAKTHRGLVSELEPTAADDGVPSDRVVNFDNIHTLPRSAFRRPIATLGLGTFGLKRS